MAVLEAVTELKDIRGDNRQGGHILCNHEDP